MLLTLSSSSMYMTGQDSTKNSCPHCSILYWHDGLLLLIVCIACQASDQRHRQASWGVMVNTGERQNTITDSTYIFLRTLRTFFWSIKNLFCILRPVLLSHITLY